MGSFILSVKIQGLFEGFAKVIHIHFSLLTGLTCIRWTGPFNLLEREGLLRIRGRPERLGKC